MILRVGSTRDQTEARKERRKNSECQRQQILTSVVQLPVIRVEVSAVVSGSGVVTVLQEGTFTGTLVPFWNSTAGPWGMKDGPRGKEVEALLPRKVSLFGAGELHS